MLDDIIQSRLQAIRSLPEWSFWEHKTLNVHRGVVRWRPQAAPESAAQVERSVRAAVGMTYRISWWRGFGFGVLLELDHCPEALAEVANLIDVYSRRRGVWQWTILMITRQKAAFGVHAWTEGYLAPVYRNLIDCLRGQGWTCQSHKRDWGRWMRFLRAVSRPPVLEWRGEE